MRVLILMMVVLWSCTNKEQEVTDMVTALGDRACACKRRNDMNFSLDSIRAATDARISNTDRVGNCMDGVVTDIVKLAETQPGSPASPRTAATARVRQCMIEAGYDNARGEAGLRRLGSPPTSPPKNRFGTGPLAELVNRMCGCKDKRCTEIVAEEYSSWMAKPGGVPLSNQPKELQAELAKCQARQF